MFAPNSSLVCLLDPFLPYFSLRSLRSFGNHPVLMIATIATILTQRSLQSLRSYGNQAYLLRSSAITIAGSQAIAEVCFHFCDLRSSAIIWKPAFSLQVNSPSCMILRAALLKFGRLAMVVAVLGITSSLRFHWDLELWVVLCFEGQA